MVHNPGWEGKVSGGFRLGDLAERVGEEPLCVVEARRVTGGRGPLTFGDVTDPNSEVSQLLRSTHTISRKNALGTGPNVYYILPSSDETNESEHVGSAT